MLSIVRNRDTKKTFYPHNIPINNEYKININVKCSNVDGIYLGTVTLFILGHWWKTWISASFSLKKKERKKR